jgi:hypothetical protein
MRTCKFDLWPVKTTSAERASLVIALVGMSALLLTAILGLAYQSGAF